MVTGAMKWLEFAFVSHCGDNEVPSESTRHPHSPTDTQLCYAAEHNRVWLCSKSESFLFVHRSFILTNINCVFVANA